MYDLVVSSSTSRLSTTPFIPRTIPKPVVVVPAVTKMERSALKKPVLVSLLRLVLSFNGMPGTSASKPPPADLPPAVPHSSAPSVSCNFTLPKKSSPCEPIILTEVFLLCSIASATLESSLNPDSPVPRSTTWLPFLTRPPPPTTRIDVSNSCAAKLSIVPPPTATNGAFEIITGSFSLNDSAFPTA